MILPLQLSSADPRKPLCSEGHRALAWLGHGGHSREFQWHRRDGGRTGKTPGSDGQGRNAEKRQTLSTSPGCACACWGGEGTEGQGLSGIFMREGKDRIAERDEDVQVKALRGINGI